MQNINELIKENKITLIFLSEWGLYLIFELVMGKFKSWNVFLMNLLPFVFFYLIARLMKWLSIKVQTPFKIKPMFLWIVSLVTCDQIIKYVIKTFVEEKGMISLISDWLFISNVLNVHGSFVTSRFDLKVNMIWIILVNVLILFFIIQGYRYYKQKMRTSFWIDLTMLLFVAGGISSFIDKVFFGGSLDFIALKGLFVADLKDFYLTIGIGCMMVELIVNFEGNTNKSNQSDIQFIKEFLNFCFRVKKK
ncbi:MAG: signal peptidase II [Halanaerobiales bacterium]|nr:signal peptidase II [Halanaerobiales bacterium]